jgi:hypothetical protein
MNSRGIPASEKAEEQATILYGIVYMEINRARSIKKKQIVWEKRTHYLHACDMQHARFEFIMSRPNKSLQGIVINAIGPALGRWVEDNKGDKLSLD